MQRFRGGLVFKAHKLLYHSTLGLRVIKKKIVFKAHRLVYHSTLGLRVIKKKRRVHAYLG